MAKSKPTRRRRESVAPPDTDRPDFLPSQAAIAGEFMADMIEKTRRHGTSPENATAAMLLAWCRIMANSDQQEMRDLAISLGQTHIAQLVTLPFGDHPADRAFAACYPQRLLPLKPPPLP